MPLRCDGSLTQNDTVCVFFFVLLLDAQLVKLDWRMIYVPGEMHSRARAFEGYN